MSRDDLSQLYCVSAMGAIVVNFLASVGESTGMDIRDGLPCDVQAPPNKALQLTTNTWVQLIRRGLLAAGAVAPALAVSAAVGS